jgi:surfeit locus 1 family protein
LDYPLSSRWKFWLITGVALLAVSATLALGRWQLSRAAYKEALQASIGAKATLPQLDGRILATRSDPTSELHRRVTLRGRWLAQRTLFLDNRPMNDKAGFYVVTPMALEDSAAVVLVQRGWVARNFVDRTSIPKIETPTGVVEIVGRIAPPPAKLYQLGGPETGLIRQNLDLAQFSSELGLPLLTVSVQQTGVATDGLLREWPPAGTGVDRNYGYAFQWFGLSGLIAMLYVWFQIVRRFIYPRRA